MIIDRLESIFVPNQVAERYRRKAIEHFNQKQYKEAAELLSQAIHLQRDSASLYLNRGAAYSNLGNYDKAIADFNTAFALKSSDPAWLLFYRAQINENRHDLDAAIQDYADALSIGLDLDKILIALERRGNMLIAKKEWTRAEKNFQALLQLDDKLNYVAHVGIGDIRLNLKDYQVAIEHFTEAILMEPQKEYSYTQRGYAYLRLWNWQPALADFEQASRLKPTSFIPRNNSGIVRTHMNDLQSALADFKSVLEIDSESPYGYIGIADIHFLRGEYDLALENAQKAHAFAPEIKGIYATLAVDYHALGQAERAVEIWQELMAKDEHYGDAEWVKQEHTWPDPLVEEARKLIARLPK